MKILTALFVLALFAPSVANAVCGRSTDYTIEDEIRDAPIVFVATITESHVKRHADGRPDITRRTKHWGYYTVQYGFEVALRIKGDPSRVPFLTTAGIWQDPREMRFSTMSEQSKFVPGDSILVVAHEPGDAPISDIGCTPSMPWGQEAKELLKRTRLLPT